MSWKFWKTKEKEPKNREAVKESASVRVLKKHVKILEEVNDALAEQVRDLSKVANKRKQEGMEEMLVGALVQMFTPEGKPTVTLSEFGAGSPSPPTPPHPRRDLETGKEYSDDELRSSLSNLSQDLLKKISGSPLILVKQKAKQIYPDISDSSIKRAQEISKELITNG